MKHTIAYESVLVELKEVQRATPYPADVFLERDAAEWTAFHAALKAAGLNSEGFLGAFGRQVWDNCCQEIRGRINDYFDEEVVSG